MSDEIKKIDWDKINDTLRKIKLAGESECEEWKPKTPDQIKAHLEYCQLSYCPLECPYYDECAAGVSQNLIDTLEYIKQLEAQVPKWIPVTERLPEVDGKYIVCTAKRSVYCTKFKAYGRGGSFQTDINTHVTHWMPLPKAPGE